MTRDAPTMATALLVLLCGALGAQEADRSRADGLSRRAADRLSELHDEADRLTAEERTVLGDLRRLEVEREIKSEEARRAENDAAALEKDLAALDGQISTIRQLDQADLPDLRARIVSLYKLGRGRYLRLLLSTADVRQIGDASRMVGVLAAQDRDRLAVHERRLTDLTASRHLLEERQTRLAALRSETSRARAEADRAVAARSRLVREIDQRRDLNAQLAGELMTAQQKLQSALTNLSDGSAGPAPALPIGPFRGDLDWPVAGTVRQRFGSTDGLARTAANGIDLAATEGDGVHAVHDGRVAFADVFAGFGRLVIIDHGAQAFSLYGNLWDVEVARGAHVQRGDVVGTVGVAVTGAEGLYFELRVDGRPVDPVQWLKKR